MSDSFVYQLSVGIPSGQQYEKGDMVNIRAENPDQFAAALDAFTAGLAAKCADAATAVKAAYAAVSAIPGASVVTEPVQQAAPPQQQPWAPAPQQQAPAGGGIANGTPHPEGKVCARGDSQLVWKQFTSKAGKEIKMWTCPNQRNRDDGHTSEMVWS